MTQQELLHLLNDIQIPDSIAMATARNRLDHIAKPIDSLGHFEEMICRIAGMQRTDHVDISKRAVISMCADNGIVSEGISQSGMEVTAIVAANMANGTANICKMAKRAGADVLPIDIGIAGDLEVCGLKNAKLRRGTRDFLIEPAMTTEEVLAAIEVGIDQVKRCAKQGYRMLATGEMGIGNTTTSSAMASVLLDLPVEAVTGRGAGLTDKGLLHKQQVIRTAISRYQVSREDPMEVLRTFGGFDIAGLAGVFIGGAVYGIPVVIDGIIASVAALTAYRLSPLTREYMLASHASKEPAALAIMHELKLHPVLDAAMALGEGTGAVMLFPLLDMALCIYDDNMTFQDIAIEDYQRYH